MTKSLRECASSLPRPRACLKLKTRPSRAISKCPVSPASSRLNRQKRKRASCRTRRAGGWRAIRRPRPSGSRRCANCLQQRAVRSISHAVKQTRWSRSISFANTTRVQRTLRMRATTRWWRGRKRFGRGSRANCMTSDADLARSFDLRNLPDSFYDDPFPTYRSLREHAPLKLLPGGGVFLSRYADVLAVYQDPITFSSDKKAEFGPKYGSGSRLFRHHTTSLVFNDAP